MWSDATRLAKEHDRRDLTLKTQDKFAEYERRKQTGNLPKQSTLSEKIAEKEMESRRKQTEFAAPTATGLKGELVQGCMQGGDAYLQTMLTRSSQLAQLVLSNQTSEDKI